MEVGSYVPQELNSSHIKSYELYILNSSQFMILFDWIEKKECEPNVKEDGTDWSI